MTILSTLTFDHQTHEGGDVYTFAFKKPAGLQHTAGQHGIFILPALIRPYPMTVSSAPEEELLTISTHTGSNSAFKKYLLSLEAGDKIYMVGPILNFTLKPDVTKYTFLAQGIGITPFRSMLVHANTVSAPIDTNLIHVNGHEHTFKDLTSEYATTASYPTNPDEFRALVKLQPKDRTFYLSGSPRYIKATKELLQEVGVPKNQVKTDSFWGY